MKNKERKIEILQNLATALSQQAEGHAIQAKIFASQGFTKLEEKYNEHASEERGYVGQAIDRIIDLGGQVKLEAKEAGKVINDPIEWIKYDLEISVNGLESLSEIIKEFEDDYTTYDFLKEYYKDEEEDMYWGETQLDLIELIGKQNWLYQQL